MPSQRRSFSMREIMEYIVANANRYSPSVVYRAQEYLTTNPDNYQPKARQESRANQRNSAARSAARNRAPAGMSSQTTQQAVNRGTGLTRNNVTDESRLRMMADSYAAFGWGK